MRETPTGDGLWTRSESTTDSVAPPSALPETLLKRPQEGPQSHPRSASHPVLVVAAVSQELRGFRPPDGVRVLVTGMGRAHAKVRLESYLRGTTVSRILSVGFCGGLDPSLKAGQTVWVDRVVEPNGSRRQAAAWSGKMEGFLPVTMLLTVDRPVRTALEKTALRAQFGAGIVDMETAAIAEVAADHGIPWNGLRVVLDPAAQPLEFDSARAALWALRRPLGWKRLFNFLETMRVAGERLAKNLNRLTEPS